MMNLSAHAAGEGRLDIGWRYLHAAERLGAYGLDRDELRAKLESLKQEAQGGKFGSWRSKAILSLASKAEAAMDSKPCAGLEAARTSLSEAFLVRNEAFDNSYYRASLIKTQLLLVYFVGAVALGLLLWVNPFSGLAESGWRMTASVMLFGALGAASSAILSLARTQTEQRIPEQVVNS